jgi:hypothetical protein
LETDDAVVALSLRMIGASGHRKIRFTDRGRRCGEDVQSDHVFIQRRAASRENAI